MKRAISMAAVVFAAAALLFSCAKPQVELTGIRVTPGSVDLFTGETKSLNVEFYPEGASGSVTWSTTDASKVGVANGVITARSATVEGEVVKIQAVCGSVRSNAVEVTVTDPYYPVEGIELSAGELSVEMGKTVTLTATVKPETASVQEVSWDFSSSRKISVETSEDTHTLTITGVSAGEVEITASSVEKPEITATCTLTVVPGYYEDGSLVLSSYDISSNAPMCYCTVLQDASLPGFIDGTRDWVYPWYQYKPNPLKPEAPSIIERKTIYGLATNLWDNNENTFFATNTDIYVINDGSWKNRYSAEWTGEYLGADYFEDWDGQYSDDGYPLSNGLTIPSLVDGHYIQVALPYPVESVSLYLKNANGYVCYTNVDQVRIQLSEDGENFQTVSDAYSFDGATETGGGELEIKNLSYDGGTEFEGKKINFIRITHNGTTSQTRDFTENPQSAGKYKVDNSGWKISGSEIFGGNASPIALAELKVWDE